MSQSLPPQANLEHLKKQAKDLLDLAKSGEDAALRAYFPDAADWALHHAQLAVARQYGFESWPRLKRHVEAPPHADAFIAACMAGRLEDARALLRDHRADLVQDPVAAAVAGEVQATIAHVSQHPELLKEQNLGPLERPLLTYPCFSRLIADESLAPQIMKTVRALLQLGADPNAYWVEIWAGEPVNESCLYGAAGVNNHPGLTKILLEAGATPDDGESLYHASEHPSNECLRLILEANPSQESKDYCIKRKLDFEDPEGVALYLQHGARMNVPSPNTALSHAVLRGRSVAILRLLVEAGADPNVPDKDGTTPYTLARRLADRDAAAYLASVGADTGLAPLDQILVAAADGDEAEVVRLMQSLPGLVEEELRRQAAEDAGNSAYSGNRLFTLHEFARTGNAAGVKALIRIGYDVNARNQWGQTPLHWACIEGHPEAVKVLLDAGADWTIKDPTYNGDAVGWVSHGSMNHQSPKADHAGVARLLKEHGARASEFGTPEVIAALADTR